MESLYNFFVNALGGTGLLGIVVGIVVFLLTIRGVGSFFEWLNDALSHIMANLYNFLAPRFGPKIDLPRSTMRSPRKTISFVTDFLVFGLLIITIFGFAQLINIPQDPDIQTPQSQVNATSDNLSELADRILLIEETLASTPSEEELAIIVDELGDLRSTILADPEKVLGIQQIDSRVTVLENRISDIGARVDFINGFVIMIIGAFIAALVGLAIAGLVRFAMKRGIEDKS